MSLCWAMVGVGLILASTGGVLRAQQAPSPALDQLQAAEAVANQMVQNPPSAPVDWRHAKDLDEASRRFAAWQQDMFRQRDEIARKQAKLLHDRMKIPPPLPPSVPDTGPAMTRLDLPLPFFPANVSLSLSVGEPTISFAVGAEAGALSCVGASYKVEAAYAAKENRWTVQDPLEIKASFGSDKVEAAGSYQLLGSVWTGSREEEADKKKEVGGEISVDILQVNAAVGYNNQRELSLTAGYDLVKTPEAFSKVFEASVGVEASVSAPVMVHGLTQGGKHSLPTVLADYSAKVAKLLTEPQPCPYCSAKGSLDCPTCRNTRTVVCPKCNGKLSYECSRCKGGGALVCPRCRGSLQESCSGCSGTGQLRCYSCSGSGHVTVYEIETRTRQELVIDRVGFDDAGNPIYDRHYETREYWEQVPKQQSCSSCGGSGSRGTCGTCGGDGTVTCRGCGGGGTVQCGSCNGTGKINCGKCRGTGKVACPTCRGKPIECPLCKGKASYGH